MTVIILYIVPFSNFINIQWDSLFVAMFVKSCKIYFDNYTFSIYSPDVNL